MCEIFSLIGGSILASVGFTGTISTAAATAIGVGATAVGGAALGAGVGAATSAIAGGDIGKGALFGAIGGGVLAPVGAGMSGVLGAAAGGVGGLGVGSAVGAAAMGSVVGGITGGMVSNTRSSKDTGAVNASLYNRTTKTNVEATERYAKTADNLKDKGLMKRTLSSLRIPLNKTSQNIGLNTGEASAATGLNIA